MISMIMLYVVIGMMVMYYVVHISKEMNDGNFEYFKETPMHTIFLVGLVWPVTITIALFKSIFED